MKATLALVLAVLMLAVVGAVAYVVYSRISQPAVEPEPVSQSSSQATNYTPKDPNNALQQELKKSTVDPATLEKLMYDLGKNEDVVAWLTVPNTKIDDAVVQSHNNTFYLRRDERKKDNAYGCYFADYESTVSTRENLSRNTVIYGHSDLKDSPDGFKFSQLFHYADKEFADKNRIITLSVPEEKLEWEVFAVFYTDIYFDYIKVNMTDEEQQKIIDTALKASIFDFGVPAKAPDRILTLSTCSVRDGNDGTHRFVVMARLKDAAAP
ncbi:MAG: class B sortase [Angelakisella sp.]